MRNLQALLALAFIAGFAALTPAAALVGRDALPSTLGASVGPQDPDGFFVRFGVAP